MQGEKSELSEDLFGAKEFQCYGFRGGRQWNYQEKQPSYQSAMVFKRKSKRLEFETARTWAVDELECRTRDQTPPNAFRQMLSAAPTVFKNANYEDTCHLCGQFVSPYIINEKKAGETPKPKESAKQLTLWSSGGVLSTKEEVVEDSKEDVVKGFQMLQKIDRECSDCKKIACGGCLDSCGMCGRALCKACLQLTKLNSGMLGLACEECSSQ